MNDLKISIKQLDDISWLVEATNDLACATENDLAAIKGKKWYHRLLDTITFSKDDQIQIAKDIGSLAKLQEIVIRVLVMLSKENAAISTVVRQHAELLQCLNIKDTALMNAIKKIKFGGTAQIDFADLGRDKKALIANLLIMADPDVQKSNYSQRYIGSIMQSANVATVDNTVHADAVESLSKVEQELLYRMIMINRYLADISFSAPSEVIDWISLNPKRKREICTDIETTGSATSPDFFVTYYERVCDHYDNTDGDDILFDMVGRQGNTSERNSSESIETEWKAIEDAMERFEKFDFVTSMLAYDFPDYETVGDDYATRAYTVMMVEQELRKIYNPMSKVLNPNEIGNLAELALDEATPTIDRGFGMLRRQIHCFGRETGFQQYAQEMEAALDETLFLEQIRKLFANELRDNRFKYSLHELSYYVGLAQIESDDINMETGFRRLLEKICVRWTYYMDLDLENDFDTIQKNYAESTNQIVIRKLNSDVFSKIRSVYAKIQKPIQSTKPATASNANKLFNLSDNTIMEQSVSAEIKISSIIKELVRRSSPDALRVQIEGKVLEGMPTVGSYCKLEGQQDVYQIMTIGYAGNLTECEIGRSTKFTLKKV